MSERLYSCAHAMSELEKPGLCHWCWNNYYRSACELSEDFEVLKTYVAAQLCSCSSDPDSPDYMLLCQRCDALKQITHKTGDRL